MSCNNTNVKVKSKFSLNKIFSKKLFFAFISLLFITSIVFSPLVSVFSEVSLFAQGTETPNKIVKNEAELTNAISVASSDKTPCVIGLSANVVLDSSLEIPSDKNIVLTSVDGVWKLFGADKQNTITVAGTLTLDGICVTHKNGSTGGGVFVKTGGVLTLLSGEILNNTGDTAVYSACGGGVYVDSGGSFVMSGGKISGNTAFVCGGGGVSNRGTFTLTSGEISCNTAYNGYGGGGVYNFGFGCGFMMSGGKISDNKAPTGGGVYNGGGGYAHGGVSAGVTFTMTGGEISGNIAETFCGGVYYVEGSFDWCGGVISGNTAGIDNNDVGNWAIDIDPVRHSNGNGGGSEEIDVSDGGDLGVASGGEVEVGSTDKVVGDLFLPVVIVFVVVVGFVVGGLLFYRSKRQNRSVVRSVIGYAVT